MGRGLVHKDKACFDAKGEVLVLECLVAGQRCPFWDEVVGRSGACSDDGMRSGKDRNTFLDERHEVRQVAVTRGFVGILGIPAI